MCDVPRHWWACTAPFPSWENFAQPKRDHSWCGQVESRILGYHTTVHSRKKLNFCSKFIFNKTRTILVMRRAEFQVILHAPSHLTTFFPKPFSANSGSNNFLVLTLAHQLSPNCHNLVSGVQPGHIFDIHGTGPCPNGSRTGPGWVLVELGNSSSWVIFPVRELHTAGRWWRAKWLPKWPWEKIMLSN